MSKNYSKFQKGQNRKCYQQFENNSKIGRKSKKKAKIDKKVKYLFCVAERKIDEKHLRKEIKIVIQNIRGVRTGLFTPDMAFERIVKEQVEQLVSAPLNLVDQVTGEIVNAVRTCLAVRTKNHFSQKTKLKKKHSKDIACQLFFGTENFWTYFEILYLL